MSVFNRVIALSLPLVPKPIVRRVAGPYIAGEHSSDLLRVALDLNRDGYMVAAAILGEFITRREEAEEAVDEYHALLDQLHAAGVDGYVHVKPTHLGLKLDREFCLASVRRVLAAAKKNGQFVRLDMEDSSCTDETLDLYYRLHQEFDNVGIVLQSRLRRSIADARGLAKAGANVRVCKGIYVEPHAIAYTDPELVSRSFVALVDELLSAGCYVGIATHDERVAWESARIVDRLHLTPDRYEFQMLLGVQAPLRRVIRSAGHRLRVAVPYGPNWYPYSLRRLRKNPALAGYVLRSLFKG